MKIKKQINVEHLVGWQKIKQNKSFERDGEGAIWAQMIRQGLSEVMTIEQWIFIGRADAEAEAPVLWPPDSKSGVMEKDPDAGKDGGQEEKGATEDETVGWPHWLNGHEFEQTHGDSEGQGSLACCSPWGHKELDTT